MNQPSIEPSREGFQSQGYAWSPYRADIVHLLQRGRHVDLTPIYYGSNHTFLVTLESEGAGSSYAVYKPARGEYPLYDFPHGTLYRREIATYLVDRILGWEIVPPTVETRGRYGAGSLQLFIEAVDSAEVEVDVLRRVALLDIILNNADRKAEHLLAGDDGHVWGIDHGLTFHSQYKLRTVLWHFAGLPLDAAECSALERLWLDLEAGEREEVRDLNRLIVPQERAALSDRIDRLVTRGAFPDPRHRTVPYRW